MFLSEAKRQEKNDKKVQKLYQEYEASQYFSGRGAYQRRPKDLKMTTSEHCFYAIVVLILTGSAFGVIWSIITIREGGQNIREQELDLFEADELAWNNTYLDQIKGINMNIIKDEDLYY
jgi:hypothetical protein